MYLVAQNLNNKKGEYNEQYKKRFVLLFAVLAKQVKAKDYKMVT